MIFLLLTSFIIQNIQTQYIKPHPLPAALPADLNSSKFPSTQPQRILPQSKTCICPQTVCTTSPPCEACPAPPPPTICPPPLACESSPKFTQQDVYPSPKTHEDPGRKISRKARAARTLSHSVVHLVNKCNDDQLRILMLQSISPNIVTAKVKIAERAAHELGGVFDVVCTNGVFSYYAAAKIFCEVSRDGVSCFAFRHDAIDSSDAPASSSSSSQESTLRDSADKSLDLNRREDKALNHRVLSKKDAALREEEESFWRTKERRGEKRSQTKTVSKLSQKKKSKIEQIRPTLPPDGVVDVHTQNLREETFQELLRDLDNNNNDGSTTF